MADYIIDTDVLIDHLRKEKKAIDFLTKCVEEESDLFCSVIAKTEIYAGARQNEYKDIEKLFASFGIIEINDEIAVNAGKYLNQFRKTHGIEIGDALMAATAKMSKMALVTRNIKHYPMKDIKISIPY